MIHCIWLGNKRTGFANACINDWEKQGYTVKIWSDKSKEVQEMISRNKFASECYKRELYAFVTDYLRLKILQQEGGFYLDTDVTILRDPSKLIENYDFVAGFESKNNVGTGILYAKEGSELINELVDFYTDEIWKTNLYIGPDILTKLLLEKGMDRENKIQEFGKGIKIYSKEYFAPYSSGQDFRKDSLSEKNTYMIHWYSDSWSDSSKRNFLRCKNKNFLGRIYIYQKYYTNKVLKLFKNLN